LYAFLNDCILVILDRNYSKPNQKLQTMASTNNNPPLTLGMQKLINELKEIVANPVVEAAFNDAIANVQPILLDGTKNQWIGKSVAYFVEYFEAWFTFLPTPIGGLGKIIPFTHLYLNNTKAFYFLNHFQSKKANATTFTKEIFNWTVDFIKERGRFMDSKESLKYIQEWIQYPPTKIDDFIIPKGGFQSFNQFFIRELKPAANARPISNPKDPNILVSSADAEINFIESELTMTTKLNVKSRQINVGDLLLNSVYAPKFEGGTALSCVLLPGSYHRYHAPVGGDIVESQEVQGIYNGIIDGDDWFNNYNIGESTTDFSIFEDFHRAYFIFETKEYGYVAMIPVGLNTISSLFPSMVNKVSTMVPPGGTPVSIKKGEEVGHFAYGGSLNILLFQPGVLQAASVLQGQRIGILNKPTN
jgi:phosphatidylserine decarboxylase